MRDPGRSRRRRRLWLGVVLVPFFLFSGEGWCLLRGVERWKGMMVVVVEIIFFGSSGRCGNESLV